MRSPADHTGALHDHQGHHDETHHHGSHDGHAGHSVAMFRDRFWLSLILTLPVVYFSETIQGWLGHTAPAFAGSELIPPVLGTVIFVYGGWPFLRGAVREAGDRQPGKPEVDRGHHPTISLLSSS